MTYSILHARFSHRSCFETDAFFTPEIYSTSAFPEETYNSKFPIFANTLPILNNRAELGIEEIPIDCPHYESPHAILTAQFGGYAFRNHPLYAVSIIFNPESNSASPPICRVLTGRGRLPKQTGKTIECSESPDY